LSQNGLYCIGGVDAKLSISLVFLVQMCGMIDDWRDKTSEKTVKKVLGFSDLPKKSCRALKT